MENKLSEFLVDSEDTGRFKVTSSRTGKTYLVETIDGRNRPPVWGDVNPASGQVEGTYGSKHKGSIAECDSIIDKNDELFTAVYNLGVGISPLYFIEKLDSVHPDKISNNEKN